MSAYGIIEEQVVPNTAQDEWIKKKCELRKEKNYLLEILPQLEGEQKDTDIEKYLPWSEELPDEIRNYEEEYIYTYYYSGSSDYDYGSPCYPCALRFIRN